ncbi:hypothetical protein BDV19DRAFT_200310 [Aspergillus venezuelensis]
MLTRAVTEARRRATNSRTTLPSKATDSNLTRHKDTPRAHHRYFCVNKPQKRTERLIELCTATDGLPATTSPTEEGPRVSRRLFGNTLLLFSVRGNLRVLLRLH